MQVGFVVCPSYEGATLLALLLNNHSQISALGDTLPSRRTDWTCACGQRVSECDFWQMVSAGLDTSRYRNLPTLLPVMPWPLAHRQIEGSVVHVSQDPRLNRLAGRLAGRLADFGAPTVWWFRRQLVADFVGIYRSFYQLVLDMHGTSTFVDGFKSWRKVALLAQELQPATEVRIIHLVRDPRGFALSRRRHGEAEDLKESAWLWADLHHRMELLRAAAPYRLLRYEDLCTQPEAEMRKLFQFFGVEPEAVVSAPKYTRKHHILGNQMLRTFSGNVDLDERWRAELSTGDQHTVLSSAGDLAERLGYTERA
jgi:Sulfotransferase domain